MGHLKPGLFGSPPWTCSASHTCPPRYEKQKYMSPVCFVRMVRGFMKQICNDMLCGRKKIKLLLQSNWSKGDMTVYQRKPRFQSPGCAVLMHTNCTSHRLIMGEGWRKERLLVTYIIAKRFTYQWNSSWLKTDSWEQINLTNKSDVTMYCII